MLAAVLLMLAMVAVYGGGALAAGIGIYRWRTRTGQLSRHDGAMLALGPKTSRRDTYVVHVEEVEMLTSSGRVVRVRVDGMDCARVLGFRLFAWTKPRGKDLGQRLLVKGNGPADVAEKLFASSDVRAALSTLCGAAAKFKSVNLYPQSSLVVDLEAAAGELMVDDAVERVLRFAEAVDRELPNATTRTLRLGAASGASGSPATFSIEIRS